MKTRKRSGQTLIEVTMATMIAAITTTAVFSVVLSSYVSDAKADKRDAASMLLKRAQDTLKSYVSAVPGEANYVPVSASGCVGCWSADSYGGWALAAGNHDISSLMNGGNNPVLNPTGAACSAGSSVCGIWYTVTDSDCGGGTGAGACKRVAFRLVYTD